MAEELQSFLNRIQQEGIQSGEEEAKNIIAEAQSKADLIIKRAKAESEETVRQAGKEADRLVAHGKDALKLAARDTLLSLRHELLTKMRVLFRKLAGDALNAEQMSGIIANIIKNYHASGVESLQVEVLLSADQSQALETALLARLGTSLIENVRISPVSGISGGFQLRLEGDEILYDFTDDALSEALNTFLSPKLVALLKD
jgi:V/A-type H+-transporting ATPase subunit E